MPVEAAVNGIHNEYGACWCFPLHAIEVDHEHGIADTWSHRDLLH